MVGSRLNVHLYRDSFNTPWGFRLQGGKDLNQPLTIQRVFSNSPAEGELQRGDVILSVNNRDSSQLTHKQAQDLIKHGGGQVQLVITRPPPGTHVGPLSPPIVPNKPRAPSLQSSPYQNSPSRPNTITMNKHGHNPSFNPSMGEQRSPHQPVHQSLHVQVIPSPQRQRTSFSQPPTTPTPTTPIPPWAAQQFEPKRVSKLSKLGGGSMGFGTDYATLPRRSSSAQYGGRLQNRRTSADVYDGPQETEPDRLATGPPPRVCNLRKLGGGGFDFGTSFGAGSASATLPRRSTGRRLSQPPSMPGGSGYGHMPTKLSLTRLGGGGPEFGSDFSKGGGVSYGQTPAQRYEPTHEKSAMLNRVHTSLDNITLSPRTPEVNASSPFYQPYEPAAPAYQPMSPAYQPAAAPAYQPAAQPAYQPAAPSYQPYQSPPQQMYTPTGLLLEQQRLQEQQEEGEAIVPVWERRRQFQAGPAAPTAVRTAGNKPPPKIPKPKPGPTQYSNFGTEYGSPQKKQPGSSWRPPPVFKPSAAPVSVAPVASYTPSATNVQYAPRPAAPAPVSYAPPPPAPAPAPAPAPPQQAWQGSQQDDGDGIPAWRSSLKATGVKPWEKDVNYSIEQEPLRSAPFKPTPAPQVAPFKPTPAPKAAPFSPPQPLAGGSDGGPKVVHLQYNSPMGLYSNQNVQETLKGQTQALAGQPNKQAPTNESGERDWSQSKVLKFINQQETRRVKQGPPAVAPKPQVSPGLPQQSGFYDDVGASDF